MLRIKPEGSRARQTPWLLCHLSNPKIAVLKWTFLELGAKANGPSSYFTWWHNWILFQHCQVLHQLGIALHSPRDAPKARSAITRQAPSPLCYLLPHHSCLERDESFWQVPFLPPTSCRGAATACVHSPAFLSPQPKLRDSHQLVPRHQVGESHVSRLCPAGRQRVSMTEQQDPPCDGPCVCMLRNTDAVAALVTPRGPNGGTHCTLPHTLS